jgi:16S rRNA processing protein RimM
LNGVGLFVARERLGEPDEDEFFLADLVGLQATLADGTVAGTVVDVQNYGSGDLLEIAPPGGGQSVLLPFTKAFVPQIDIGGGRVVIDSDEFATPSDDAGVREARG